MISSPFEGRNWIDAGPATRSALIVCRCHDPAGAPFGNVTVLICPPTPTTHSGMAELAGTFQSNTNSPGPNSFLVARYPVPPATSFPPATRQAWFSGFPEGCPYPHPSRLTPLKRALCPASTVATSAGFGFVLGSSLILRLRKRHSDPSD